VGTASLLAPISSSETCGVVSSSAADRRLIRKDRLVVRQEGFLKIRSLLLSPITEVMCEWGQRHSERIKAQKK